MKTNQNKFFPELNEPFKEILESVSGKNIAVLGHMRPDGDCIGSQISAANLFRKCGAKEVLCINKDKVPFLYEKYAKGEIFIDAETFKDKSFEIITVDCADYSRTSDNIKNTFKEPLACIDHHLSNNAYAKINVIDANASSTTELIAGLMCDLGISIDKGIANPLYVGLVMDTRQFTTNSTTAKSLEVASMLAKSSADICQISIDLYQREKFAKMKLLARYLQSIKLYANAKICGGVLRRKDFVECGALKEDSDGLVDFARNVNDVEVAFLIEELSDGAKASLRSKDAKYAVNEIAAKFGGGGHACAAGCNTKDKFEEFEKKIIETISSKI